LIALRSLLYLGILAALAVARPAIASDKTTVRRFAMTPHHALELQVPIAWSTIIRKRPDHSIFAIVFGPVRGIPFEVTLAPSLETTPTDAAARERALHQSVDRLANAIKGQATASELKIVKLDVTGGAGLYFSATDRAPRPMDYGYVTQGTIQLGELSFNFTILTRDGQDQVVPDALSMLKSAKLRN
jgi:hypothetical protein